ncbi:DUF1642 domain-containing protein [Streptococcus suis]|uniref:DUF1642 domain-containing protein n=1 Tax=Streptococcus suis TaxID=1307 RepID=UPI0005CD8392|nr:DUF1642 domain-containing protein [Streptococcus suis]CYV83333.1 phage protein [Streptococcus suis]
MNKQEAIKCIEQMGEYERFVDEPISKASVLSIISQIHEPQTVVLPKEVAEWIEYCKTNELTLLGAFDPVSEHGIGLANTFTGEVWKGVDWAKRNQETFARAWLDGYEIEQEKLYTVEIPDPNRSDTVTFLYKENGKVFIGSDIFLDEVPNYKWKNEPENQLTEAEIKQDFEWAWRFREEVD